MYQCGWFDSITTKNSWPQHTSSSAAQQTIHILLVETAYASEWHLAGTKTVANDE